MEWNGIVHGIASVQGTGIAVQLMTHIDAHGVTDECFNKCPFHKTGGQMGRCAHLHVGQEVSDGWLCAAPNEENPSTATAATAITTATAVALGVAKEDALEFADELCRFGCALGHVVGEGSVEEDGRDFWEEEQWRHLSQIAAMPTQVLQDPCPLVGLFRQPVRPAVLEAQVLKMAGPCTMGDKRETNERLMRDK